MSAAAHIVLPQVETTVDNTRNKICSNQEVKNPVVAVNQTEFDLPVPSRPLSCANSILHYDWLPRQNGNAGLETVL